MDALISAVLLLLLATGAATVVVWLVREARFRREYREFKRRQRAAYLAFFAEVR